MKLAWEMGAARIWQGDVLEVLRTMGDESVNCVVTSPPYWGLRDYGVEGQMGLERTVEEYVDKMVEVFREVRRVLRKDGTCWVNMGDCYASGDRGTYRSGASDNKGHQVQDDQPRPKTPEGLKPKDLVGLAWRVAFALQADGWWLRSDIVWHKPNPMPESVQDRPTRAHEYIFLLTRSQRYWYDAEAIKEPAKAESVLRCAAGFHGNDPVRDSHSHHGNGYQRGNGYHIEKRNKRDVWELATRPYPGAHFATYPPELVIPCVLAGCPEGGVVLDPFAGTSATGEAALRCGRGYWGIELKPEHVALSVERLGPLVSQLELLGKDRGNDE